METETEPEPFQTSRLTGVLTACGRPLNRQVLLPGAVPQAVWRQDFQGSVCGPLHTCPRQAVCRFWENWRSRLGPMHPPQPLSLEMTEEQTPLPRSPGPRNAEARASQSWVVPASPGQVGVLCREL